jgi:hypothetical protein
VDNEPHEDKDAVEEEDFRDADKCSSCLSLLPISIAILSPVKVKEALGFLSEVVEDALLDCAEDATSMLSLLMSFQFGWTILIQRDFLVEASKMIHDSLISNQFKVFIVMRCHCQKI